MTEEKDHLRQRTKAFSLRVIKLCNALPDAPEAKVIRWQLLKAGTSVGANYRAATRARSDAEFISKLHIVEEEADECMFWMELIVDSGLLNKNQLAELHQEADEILAMVVSSIKTTRSKNK